MTFDSIRDFAVIVGEIATAVSVVMALCIYVSNHLLKQAEHFWDLIYDCEQDFLGVYREFDIKGVFETVGVFISHERILHVLKIAWENRDLSKENFEDLIQTTGSDITYAAYDSLYRGNTFQVLSYNVKFAQALYKIRFRYPLLHKLLTSFYGLMKYSAEAPQKASNLIKLVRETILKMHEKGDLQKHTSVQGVQSFLYAVIVANFQHEFNRIQLNKLFERLSSLLKIVLDMYRGTSPLKLWYISRIERSIAESKYTRNKTSDQLKAFIDLKKKELGNSYGEVANLVGQATLILESEDSKDHDD